MQQELDEPPSAASLQICDDDEPFDIFLNYNRAGAIERLPEVRVGPESVEEKITMEIEKYKRLSRIPNGNSLNVIDWWKNSAREFPLLSRVARFVYAIPASSASTENQFSTAGHTFNERLTNMESHKLEDLLLLKINSDIMPLTTIAGDDSE